MSLFASLFYKKKPEYNSEELIKVIEGFSSNTFKFNDSCLTNNDCFITIEANRFKCKFDIDFDEFITIYYNDSSTEIIFFNNPKNDFIEILDDDLCYGQYVSGMEFIEGRIKLNLDSLSLNKVKKIVLGISLYVGNLESKLNLSNSFIKEFVITLNNNNVTYYSIQPNYIDTNSKYVSLLSLNKVGPNWHIKLINNEYSDVGNYLKSELKILIL